MKHRNHTVCGRIGVRPSKPAPDSKIGLAIESLGNGILHGLRHPEQLGSNGWFIWCGEFSDHEKFFSPICLEHIENYVDTKILDYLNLPPGYRFLIDGNTHEDIWFDKNLLNIKG